LLKYLLNTLFYSDLNTKLFGVFAGWLVAAYFLGGYGPDAQGMNDLSRAITVAVKSWAVGVPVSPQLYYSNFSVACCTCDVIAFSSEVLKNGAGRVF
jgi:hypothetical protein